MNAYWDHIKFISKHFIPKGLLAIKSVTDIMKHPVHNKVLIQNFL